MIRVRQVRVEIDNKKEEEIKRKTLLKLNKRESDLLSFQIIRESIDARKKEDIHYVYEVEVELKDEETFLKKERKDIVKTEKLEYHFTPTGTKPMKKRPIIAGSGPSGLFAAYLLAEHGYRPLILERGEKMENRVKTVEYFWKTGILNENSNVQFGEGGAGTFSDGKLNTMVKDKGARCKRVFEILVENGAPSDICYLQKPHIGTDKLRTVISNIRERILKMGGEIRYQSEVTDFVIESERLTAIEVNKKEIIPCDILVLAIGHSARDTFQKLYDKGLLMQPKPFAIGVRMMHPQRIINEAQYGKYHDQLPPSTYKLTYKTKEGRGVYSFCMCPGGYVVNASSEKERLVVNGMSNYERESENANSAIVVTITEEDYGHHPLDGMYYQQKLESLIYHLEDGKIPVQRLEDFYLNRKTTRKGKINPTVKGSYAYSNLNEALPKYIVNSLKEAFPIFDQKIKGFGQNDALLLGLESRTSSPIRMVRSEIYEANIKGIFPCGEGSGYAGGITTAAMDGMRVAESIASIWARPKM